MRYQSKYFYAEEQGYFCKDGKLWEGNAWNYIEEQKRGIRSPYIQKIALFIKRPF